MLHQWKKRRILKKFLSSLPSDLARRYGKNDFYTVGQLNRTLKEEGYSSSFHGYAQVTFLTEEDAKYELSDETIYHKIRQELATKYFDGDIEFTAVPLTKRQVGNSGFSSLGVTSEVCHD